MVIFFGSIPSIYSIEYDEYDHSYDDPLKMSKYHVLFICSVVADRKEDNIPESCTNNRCHRKKEKIHPKYTCRDRDQLTNSGDKSPKKCRDAPVFLKKTFCMGIVLRREKDVLSVSRHEPFDNSCPQKIAESVVDE